MSFQITVESILIQRFGVGEDRVYLQTHLPEGSYPYIGLLTISFRVAQGSAETYCRNNFPGQEFIVETFK